MKYLIEGVKSEEDFDRIKTFFRNAVKPKDQVSPSYNYDKERNLVTVFVSYFHPSSFCSDLEQKIEGIKVNEIRDTYPEYFDGITNIPPAYDDSPNDYC